MKLRKRRRRRAPRVEADCDGRIRIDAGSPWLACRVIDVSLDGAALELPEGVDAPARRIIHLELSQHRDEHLPGAIELLVEIRNSGPEADGNRRLGVKFATALSDLERRFIEASIYRTAR